MSGIVPGKFDAAAYGELSNLGYAVEDRRKLDAQITEHVRALRGRLVPWEDIAQQLGVSRQAAQQRFAHVDPPRSRKPIRRV